ncbi:hypothetical protein HDU99_002517, partial [Rhizoclosmatium hyalinum]
TVEVAAAAFQSSNPGLLLVAWLRSAPPLSAPVPTAADLALQLRVQSAHPHAAGMLVQVTTANRPSRFFPEVADPRPPAPLVAPVHCLRAFRVVTLAVPDQPDVVNVEADEVFVGVLEQLYPSPSVLRNVNNTINTAIADSLQLYQQLHSHLPSHSTAASELDNTLSSYMLNVRRTTATSSSPYSDLNGFIDIHTRIVADAQLKIQTAIDDLVGKLRIDYNELLESGSHAVKPFDHIVQEIINSKNRTSNWHQQSEAATTQYLANIHAAITVATSPFQATSGGSSTTPANNPYATAGIPGIINPSPYHQHFHHIHATTPNIVPSSKTNQHHHHHEHHHHQHHNQTHQPHSSHNHQSQQQQQQHHQQQSQHPHHQPQHDSSSHSLNHNQTHHQHDEPSTALAELEDLVNNAPSSTSIAPIKDNKKARKTRKDKGGKRSVPNPANFTEKKGDDVVSNGGSVGVAMKEDGEGSTATGGVEEEEEGALDEMEVDT